MLFAGVVPAAVWLLLHFTAEACIEGNMMAPKLPHGAVETCDDGNMTANVASPIQPGTNITLSCQLNPLYHTGPCRTVIFLNSSELIRSSGHAVSTSFLVPTYGKHHFTCKLVCEQKKKLICGIEIESGNPPDEPRNVSCIQNGTDGHPTCTWDKGRLTYISTTYIIQLSNGTDVTCTLEKSPSEKSGSLSLSKLSFDSTYTLVVAASNELGSASSQPLVFTLIDIVKPHLFNFSVEFENSATNCSLSWHAEAGAQHCRLRYRPLARHVWNTVESLGGEKCSLDGLEPHTDYEFHLSCKIHPERGLWSNWHVYQTRTPEAVPTGLLDVWYRQQDMDNQKQKISLFWKALSRSEAGGRILHYRVTFKARGQQRSPTIEDITNHTSYTRDMPRVGYKITVTAENSRGRSPPASIITSLGTQGLPPPQEVSAMAMGNSSILVSWKPPAGLVASPLRGYVVEWAELGKDTGLEPHPTWVKLPASNLSTVITEHIKGNACYQISVFALYGDRAGQGASVRGHSSAEAPSAGPQALATRQENGLLVSWAPIPAHQQRGCITGYHHHLYLQNKNQEEALAIYGPGEWVVVVLTCSFFIFSTCVCSTPPARKVLHSLLSALVPQWQDKAIPDPANATWAKNYESTKAELSSPSSLFLSTSSFEEPETTQVEEAFVKGDPPGLLDQLLLGTGQQGGGHWPLASGSGQEYEGDTEGDPYEQQLPDLYKRMVVEVSEQTQSVSEYIANPVTTYPPPVTGDHPELEGDLLSIFPTAFLMPYEGNLTLDVVKLNSSSFAR